MTALRNHAFALAWATLSVASCSSRATDLACIESWYADSEGSGAKWLTDCVCADWAAIKGMGRPTDAGLATYVVVPQCNAGVVAVQGPRGDFGDSHMICCEAEGKGQLCACTRDMNAACKGKTLSPWCTTSGLSGSGSTSGGTCTHEEPHTTLAACSGDSDCYSGFCNEDGKSPYCWPPTDTARDQGRGYDCTADAECEAVAPDFVKRGGKAVCYRSSNTAKHRVCNFTCPQ
jgi:hypothetical protein